MASEEVLSNMIVPEAPQAIRLYSHEPWKFSTYTVLFSDIVAVHDS